MSVSCPVRFISTYSRYLPTSFVDEVEEFGLTLLQRRVKETSTFEQLSISNLSASRRCLF